MADELKRCPFCGASAAWLTESGFMECGVCTATGTADGAEGWNRRPIEDALRAERDAAVADVARLREVIAAALAAAEQRGAERERAKIVAYLRLAAEAHAAPAMSDEADCIESGRYVPALGGGR